MAVAGDARARHPRLDQAAVPRRPSTRMGAQAAALPPATPIRTDHKRRPQNDPAALTRLALGRPARRRVPTATSAPSPDRLTARRLRRRPADEHAMTPLGVSLPAKDPNSLRAPAETPPAAPHTTPNAQPPPRSTHPSAPKRPIPAYSAAYCKRRDSGATARSRLDRCILTVLREMNSCEAIFGLDMPLAANCATSSSPGVRLAQPTAGRSRGPQG